MKTLPTALLTLISLASLSQATLPNNFQVGNYIEVFKKDSLKIYFNCTGTVVDKKCASYYRMGKIDSSIINVKGEFSDHYINGQLYFRAAMHNNKLEGPAQYFYKDGILKEEGDYINDIRNGKWTYYYPNGKIEKIFNYVNGEPLIADAYTKKGEATVVNGNGNIKIEFSTYMQCSPFDAWGDVVNGKKNGKWTFSNPDALMPIATEIYEDGKFVKGGSKGYEYSENPKIKLTKFYPTENLSLLGNNSGCQGDRILSWNYKDKDIYTTFYPELQDHISKYDSLAKDQWLIVGIKISKKNKLSEVNVSSSIDDGSIENYVYNTILKMKDWKTDVINLKKVESNIFFPILIDKGQMLIPAYYIHNNRKN